MKIYIDLDGVIADFHGWIKQHIPDINEDMWRNTDIPWKFLNENYKIVYRDLKPLHLLPQMNYLYNHLDNVKFLTALPNEFWDNEKGNIAKQNKTYWLKKHITNFNSNDVIFTPTAKAKIKYAEHNAVLYDDRQDTIQAWNNAGGIGILVKGE